MIRKIAALLAVALLPQFALAERIEVTVAGMVCSFCAQGIEKTIRREAGVQEVIVELEKYRVTVLTEDPKTLSDEKLRSLITDAGYDITAIARSER